MSKKNNEWAETLEELMKGERPRYEGSTTVLYLDELDRVSDAEMAVYEEHARATKKALEFVQMTRRPQHMSVKFTEEEREAFDDMKAAQTTAPTIRRIDKQDLLDKLNYTLECHAVAKQGATTADDKALINQSIWPIIDIVEYVKSMPEV